jgi:hypothetical protein
MTEQTNGTKTIKLEMSLSDQLGLAIGSERAELVPNKERILRDLGPEVGDTPNEKALIKNMVSWIELACEAAKTVIEKKQTIAALELRAENAEMRLKLIDHKLRKQQHETVKLMRVADGRDDDQVVFDTGEDMKLWDF